MSKKGDGPVHEPTAEAAADEEMLLNPDEDVPSKSFTSELIRGRIQLEKVQAFAKALMNYLQLWDAPYVLLNGPTPYK